MSQHLDNTGEQDNIRINIHQAWEVKDWAEEFGISQVRLIEVVNKVGPLVKDIKSYIDIMKILSSH